MSDNLGIHIEIMDGGIGDTPEEVDKIRKEAQANTLKNQKQDESIKDINTSIENQNITIEKLDNSTSDSLAQINKDIEIKEKELKEKDEELEESLIAQKEESWQKDELKIGGSNLLSNTSSETTVADNGGWGKMYPVDATVVGGDTFIASAMLTPRDVGARLRFAVHKPGEITIFSGGSKVVNAGETEFLKHEYIVSEKYKGYSLSIQILNSISTSNASINISKFKVEKSKIATEWLPNPREKEWEKYIKPIATMEHFDYLYDEIKHLRNMILEIGGE